MVNWGNGINFAPVALNAQPRDYASTLMQALQMRRQREVQDLQQEQLTRQGQQQEQARQRQGVLQAMIQQEQQAGESPNVIANKLYAIDPQAGRQYQEYIQQQQKIAFENQKNQFDIIAAQNKIGANILGNIASTIQTVPPEQRNEVYQGQLVSVVQKMPGLAPAIQHLQGNYTPAKAQKLQQLASDMMINSGEYKALSDIGQLNQDVKMGIVTPQQAQALLVAKAKSAKDTSNNSADNVALGKAPSGYRWINPNDPNSGLIAIEGGPGAQKSGEVAKLTAITTSSLNNIAQMRKVLSKPEYNGRVPITEKLPNIAQDKDVQKISTLKTQLADDIGRLVSGGQIGKDEAITFKTLIPRYGDKAEHVTWKLDQLQNRFNTIAEATSGLPQPKAQIPLVQNIPQVTNQYNGYTYKIR